MAGFHHFIVTILAVMSLSEPSIADKEPPSLGPNQTLIRSLRIPSTAMGAAAIFAEGQNVAMIKRKLWAGSKAAATEWPNFGLNLADYLAPEARRQVSQIENILVISVEEHDNRCMLDKLTGAQIRDESPAEQDRRAISITCDAALAKVLEMGGSSEVVARLKDYINRPLDELR